PIYPDEALPVSEVQKLAGLDLSSLEIKKTAFDLTRPHLLSAEAAASNNWAIAPGRTRGGKSIVANDTHLGISMPSFWLIMNLDAPGYRVAGVMLPGIPLVVLGYNGHVAWGATMVIADNQDLFLEKLRPRPGAKGKQDYLYRGV